MEASSSPAQPAAPARNVELWVGVALVALLGVLFALGGAEAITHRGELRPLRAGDTAPDFTLPTPSFDAQVKLSSLRGNVVLLDFWATWCPPCLRELPELAALHNDLKDRGFSVLGVNREPEDVAGVKRFVTEKQLPFPVVVDNQAVGEGYKIVSLPMTVLLDRQGKVIRQFMGYTQPDVIRAAVETALRQPPAP